MTRRLVLLALISFGPWAAADLKFVKEGRPSITLTFAEASNTAAIVDQTRDGVLIEGKTVLDDKENFVIQREEGDVCPDVRVHLNRNLFKTGRGTADVAVITEDAGTAARTAECASADIEGHYLRAE